MNDYRKDFKTAQKEFYWSLPRVSVMIITVFVVMGGLGWLAQGNQFFLFKFFAPKYEAVRRDVQIESRAYTEATIRNLYTYRRQYLAAKSDDERNVLKASALHEFSIFPEDRLPPDLRAWMVALKSGQ